MPITTVVMVLVCLAAIGSGHGCFGDGVFVHEGKVEESAGSNLSRSLGLDGANFWFIFALTNLSKVLWTWLACKP